MYEHRTVIRPQEWVYATGHKSYEIGLAAADIQIEILADDPVTLELEFDDPVAVVPLSTGHRINFKGRTEQNATLRVQTPRNSTKLVYQAYFEDLDDDIKDPAGYEGAVLHIGDVEELAIDQRARAVVQARLIAAGLPESQIADILAGVDPNSPESDFEFDDELDDLSEISMFQLEEEDRRLRQLEEIEQRIEEQRSRNPRPEPDPDPDVDEEPETD